MHGNVAAVSVAVNQRVFCPPSLVWAHAATSDHLLHVIRRELVVRRQTTLAGDHLRRKRTCGGIRQDEPKPSPKTSLFPLLRRFRSHSVEMSCFKRVYVPFRHRIFYQNIHFTARRWEQGGFRREQEMRNDADVRRVCVRDLWQHAEGGCDWTVHSSVHFGSTWQQWFELLKQRGFPWFTEITVTTCQSGEKVQDQWQKPTKFNCKLIKDHIHIHVQHLYSKDCDSWCDHWAQKSLWCTAEHVCWKEIWMYPVYWENHVWFLFVIHTFRDYIVWFKLYNDENELF